MKVIVAISVAISVLFISPLGAQAQCQKDTDCKGTRICNAGTCMSPTTVETPNTLAPEQPAYTPPAVNAPQLGWARGAGIVGLAFSAFVLGAHMGSLPSIGDSDDPTPWILIGTSWLGTAVLSPVVFAGGASARRHSQGDARGVLGLRITGWIMYGIYNVIVIAGIATAVTEAVSTDDGRIMAGVGAVPGVLSLLSFSVDAFVSRRQAKEAFNANATVASDKRMLIAPSITPLRGPDGSAGAVVGVGGTF